MIATIRAIYGRGGLMALFENLTGTLFRQSTYAVARFSIYEQLKCQIQDHTQEPTLSLAQMTMAGAVAGLGGGIVGNPAEVVMVRMFADGNKPIEKRYHYSNALSGLRNMIKAEGLSSTISGMAPNVVRTTLMTGTQLPSYAALLMLLRGLLLMSFRYDWAKRNLMNTFGLANDMKTHLCASAIASTVSTTICSPADVLKSRLMAYTRSQSLSLASFRQMCSTSYQNEGPFWLYRAWSPAMARSLPQTALMSVFCNSSCLISVHVS